MPAKGLNIEVTFVLYSNQSQLPEKAFFWSVPLPFLLKVPCMLWRGSVKLCSFNAVICLNTFFRGRKLTWSHRAYRYSVSVKFKEFSVFCALVGHTHTHHTTLHIFFVCNKFPDLLI